MNITWTKLVRRLGILNRIAGVRLLRRRRLLVGCYLQHADWIRAYYGKHGKTFKDAITGTVEILGALKSKGIPVFALSNWNGECFAVAEE